MQVHNNDWRNQWRYNQPTSTVKTTQVWVHYLVWIKYASRINTDISWLFTMRSKSQTLIDFNDYLVSEHIGGKVQEEKSNRRIQWRYDGQWQRGRRLRVTSVFLQWIQIQIHQLRCGVFSTMPTNTNTNTNTSGAVGRLFSFNDVALRQHSSMWDQTSLLDITTIRTQ